MLKDGKWNRRFDCCLNCGTTKRSHGGFGLCTRCYHKQRGELQKYGKLLNPKEVRKMKKINHLRGYKKVGRATKKRWANFKYRKKMKKIYSSLEYRKKMSKIVKKRWADPEFREKMREIHENPEHRRKILKARSKIKGKFPGLGKQGKYYSKKNKKKIYYQSSYELRAYKILEKTHMVMFYKRGPRIIYKDKDGREHYYFPDILVKCKNKKRYLIEVKSEYFLKKELEINKRKFKAAKRWCKKRKIKFIVWTEDKLL